MESHCTNRIFNMGNSDMELRDITYSQPYRNYITVQANGGSFYKMDIPLNSKECQLLLDKMFINESWDLLCRSVEEREGVVIQGNYNLVSFTIEGKTRPLH